MAEMLVQESIAGQPETSEFTTVFELTAGGIRAKALSHLAISLVLVIGGIVGLIRHKRILNHRGIFGVLVVLGLGWFNDNMELFNLAVSDIKGNTRTAEGVVHVSRVAGYLKSCGGDEITVGGQTFNVNYVHTTPGYKQTIVRDGVLRGGVYARLHHYNSVILKVEIKGKQIEQPTSLTTMIIWGLASTIVLLLLGAIAYIMMTYFSNLRQIAAVTDRYQYDWEGHKIQFDAILSHRRVWIASLNDLWVDGILMAHSGGFCVESKASCEIDHKGVPVPIEMVTKTYRGSPGQLEYRLLIHGSEIDKGILKMSLCM